MNLYKNSMLLIKTISSLLIVSGIIAPRAIELCNVFWERKSDIIYYLYVAQIVDLSAFGLKTSIENIAILIISIVIIWNLNSIYTLITLASVYSYSLYEIMSLMKFCSKMGQFNAAISKDIFFIGSFMIFSIVPIFLIDRAVGLLRRWGWRGFQARCRRWMGC